MNTLIECLNSWGEDLARFGWPMLVQSTVAILVLSGLNWALRERVRGALRHALLLLVLVKLVLPPSLALPTGVGYWLPAERSQAAPTTLAAAVLLGDAPPVSRTVPVKAGLGGAPPLPGPPPARAVVLWPGALFLAWMTGVACLSVCLWRRLRWARRLASEASASPAAAEEVAESCRQQLGLRRPVRLRVSDRPISPAVCGLRNPTILLPRALLDKLTPLQTQAVLLHELGHVKRGDLWANHLQTILQILYWYNPFLWLANALIRRVREQAVDELVMVAMDKEAVEYPAALLAVARLSVPRPAASLGLIGVAESRQGLSERVRRLVNRPAPTKAGLGLTGFGATLALAAALLPMAPGRTEAEGPGAGATKPAEASSEQVTRLVKEGRELYENGRAAEAGKKLEEAVSLAPENKAAWYYLELANGKVGLSEKRKAIMAKLQGIKLSEVLLDGLPLNEAVRCLSEEVRRLDPEGRGVNFILAESAVSSDKEAAPGAGGSSATRPASVAAALVTIKPPLRDISLEEALEAIVRSTAPPLKYTVEDYGVVISPKGSETPPLHVRTFKVAPDQFARSFLNAAAAGGKATAPGAGGVGVRDKSGGVVRMTNASVTVALARERLAAVGIDLRPPKAIFYNDRLGVMMVRASSEDLSQIEAWLQTNALNQTPPAPPQGSRSGDGATTENAGKGVRPQINIRIQYLVVTQAVGQANGFSWHLGNWSPANVPAAAAPNGAMPRFAAEPAAGAGQPTPHAAAPSGVFPSPGGAAVADPAQATVCGILTADQAREVLRALERRPGGSLHILPEVTTLSGRQTQVKTVDIKSVVTGLDTNHWRTNESGVGFTPIVEPFESGPVADLVPWVRPDGKSIELTVVWSLREFAGYDDTKNEEVRGTSPEGRPVTARKPLPLFRECRLDGRAVVGDGQTLVLSSITAATGVPAAKAGPSPRRCLAVFVTPQIVDEAGNRAHLESEIPLGIPPQK